MTTIPAEYRDLTSACSLDESVVISTLWGPDSPLDRPLSSMERRGLDAISRATIWSRPDGTGIAPTVGELRGVTDAFLLQHRGLGRESLRALRALRGPAAPDARSGWPARRPPAACDARHDPFRLVCMRCRQTAEGTFTLAEADAWQEGNR